MKYTLLELTQDVLSSLDADQVNSINDTEDAAQVAKVIRTVYYDIVNRADLPEHYTLVNLNASTDLTKPTLMTVPDNVAELKWVKYNCATLADPSIDMQTVAFMSIDQFIDMIYLFNTTDSTIGSFEHTIGPDTYTFLYRNDKAPQYYSTFDDDTLIFDSYDIGVDTTLQRSKTTCYAKTVIPFSLVDTFIPDMDEPQFSLLLAEAKSLAWTELKQTPHPKAEQSAKRGWANLRNTKFASQKPSDLDLLPNFGRK